MLHCFGPFGRWVEPQPEWLDLKLELVRGWGWGRGLRLGLGFGIAIGIFGEGGNSSVDSLLVCSRRSELTNRNCNKNTKT